MWCTLYATVNIRVRYWHENRDNRVEAKLDLSPVIKVHPGVQLSSQRLSCADLAKGARIVFVFGYHPYFLIYCHKLLLIFHSVTRKSMLCTRRNPYNINIIVDAIMIMELFRWFRLNCVERFLSVSTPPPLHLILMFQMSLYMYILRVVSSTGYTRCAAVFLRITVNRFRFLQ